MKIQSSYETIIADLTHQLYRARLISRGWKKLAKLERSVVEVIIKRSGEGRWDDERSRQRTITHERKKISVIRNNAKKSL